MLVEELKPFIESQYRTKRDARHTGLALIVGGVASLYLALKYPNVFGRAGVVSPRMVCRQTIVHYVNRCEEPNVRIWIDMGTKEDERRREQQSVADARLLRVHSSARLETRKGP